MSDKMKVREGKDGFDYPYTSPDIVIDENGKSATTKFNELSTQFKDIVNESLKNSSLTNVLSLGAKNDGSVDCTEIINNALLEGKSLFFPRGTYLIEYLKLNPKNVLIGENDGETKLKPNTSSKPAFIYISTGFNDRIRFENFQILKSPNNGQIGIDIVAKSEEPNSSGGLSDSTIKNIYLTSPVKSEAWNGIGMRLIGTGSDSNLPIQCNIFERVCIWSNNDSDMTNIPLVVEGQVEQNLFNRCTFSGLDYDKKNNNLENVSALFRRKRNDDGSVDGDIGGGSNTFTQCYFGNNPCCISLERSWNPVFVNCYFENSRQIAKFSISATATFISGSYLNVGGETNLIISDVSLNCVNLISVNITGQINCRGANLINTGLINIALDEVAVINKNIAFNDIYTIVHCNTSESIETIINITPSPNIKSNFEFYFSLSPVAGKSVFFSKENGNIYNDLTIDIGSEPKLIKAVYIPHINKYKIEIV